MTLDSADFAAGKLRAQLIALIDEAREQELHTRELIRRSARSPRAVHVALEQLESQGVLTSRRVGNIRLWALNGRNPLLRPLLELAKRTVGLPSRLRSALGNVGGIDLAFIFGSFALGTEDTTSDIDVFVLGHPDWDSLARANATLRSEFAREINIVAWTGNELRERSKDSFYRSLRTEPKIWLIGKEGDLEDRERDVARTVRGGDPGGPRRKARRTKQARARGTKRSSR